MAWNGGLTYFYRKAVEKNSVIIEVAWSATAPTIKNCFKNTKDGEREVNSTDPYLAPQPT